MNDKMGGGWAVGRVIRTSLVLAFLFLFASGANAKVIDVNEGDSITTAIDGADLGDTVQVNPGTYTEDIVVNVGVILRGVGNPTLTNASPGKNVIEIKTAGVAVTGFNITGTSVAGILVNGSPDLDTTKPVVVYNNIYDNGVGLENTLTEFPTDAYRNFWGKYGIGSEKGKPGAGSGTHVNNDVDVHTVNYDPWLTAYSIDGNYTDALQQLDDNCDQTNILILNNSEAGIDVAISGGTIQFDEITNMGSALYNASPYHGSATLPGTAVKYYDVYVKNYFGGSSAVATMDIDYSDVVDPGVLEDTLTPYVLHDSRWEAASNVVVDSVHQKVHGTFPVSVLDGSPIALVGQSYKVTILPHATPNTPISQKPVFTTFMIESVDDIGAVYYQLDGHSSSGWNPILDGTGIGTGLWENPGWSITDGEWANVTNGTHTFYFKFTTTSSAVGDNGEISWQFTRGGVVPPVIPIVITSPKAGDTLTRTPWKITWTMPTPENVLSVDLWFARDGDFTMRGGLNNPLHLATLGADTSYLWRSPNFQTDTAKIAAVVIYNDGTQYVGISDNFSLAKGYSFHAYKPTPKTPWQLGSGVSRAVAVLGSWF
ncbi:Uncharacterised protein [uncultured archaeon]|nr:Uncharacterised protein [uncultured archaeon]